MKTIVILIAAAALTLSAQKADNTKVNQRDRNTNAPAADTQGNSKADVERTAAIRKAIKSHKDLSTYANNVKIVTQNSRVTLRGPVRDESEKALIGKIATDIAGAENVTNDLDIAPKKK